MSLKQFIGATSREAMIEVRRVLGDEAVVISTRRVREGYEITAATPDAIADLSTPELSRSRAASPTASRAAKRTGSTAARVDAARREFAERSANGQPVPLMAFLHAGQGRVANPAGAAIVRNPRTARAAAQMAQATSLHVTAAPAAAAAAAPVPLLGPDPIEAPPLAAAAADAGARAIDSLIDELKGQLSGSLKGDLSTQLRSELRSELATIREWMSSQLETLAFDDQSRRRPIAAGIQKALLSAGFSPRLARDIAARLPDTLDAGQARGWTCQVLERNLGCVAPGSDPVETGGIFALVGPTGVGKTTTVAKLAARAAVKHGRDSVGLVTIDSYRIGAQDQLRIYGKILGITVHTAQDRESLLAVLRSLSGKRLVLIDTVGVGQRDARVAEVLATVGASAVRRLLVLNAAAQAETLEDVVAGYRAGNANGLHGAVLSKTDEAVRLGGALDVLIRHRLPLLYETNGQRVPEDLATAEAKSLVLRAVTHTPVRAFDVPADEVGMAYFDRKTVKPLAAAVHA